MKNILKVMILMLVLLGCKSKPVKEKQIDKGDAANTLVLQELILNKEKIYLLSLASKVSFDTVKLVIKDYYLNEYDILFNKTLSLRDSSIIDYKESIQSISRKYHLSESKVASLLFSFKYEMRTPQQIIDEYQDQQVDYREFEDQ
jgi:hypothetical protein